MLSPQELNSLSDYPLIPPPEGLKSNFGKNARSRNGAFFVVESALLGIMLAFFLNRLYTKALIIRKYSWDDRE